MLPDHLGPDLRVVIAGTVRAGCPAARGHYYAGTGNRFWRLLHESGLVGEPLEPQDDARLPALGIGLTDVLKTVVEVAGAEPIVRYEVESFAAKIGAVRPRALAFASKTAATAYARAAGERVPRDYGVLSWTVAGVPAFVLPGPSGANNGMPLPLRVALWCDLADFLDSLDRGSRAGPEVGLPGGQDRTARFSAAGSRSSAGTADRAARWAVRIR